MLSPAGVLLPDEILRLRLANQHLADSQLSDPSQLVARMGAVQSQDYPAAMWAVGQRLCGATSDTVERAFANGAILRTHVLRPTWHLVTPADIHWLLELTAPRVKMAMAATDRVLGIDAALLTRSNAAIAHAVEGGTYLSRPELDVVLRQAGVEVHSGQMLAHLVMRAELDRVVCSGPWRGKQATYALLDERAPVVHRLQRDEALAELSRRYFTSHGPATLRDFTWWSGLTVADARRGLQLNGSRFVNERVDGLSYWFAPAAPPPPAASLRLLPNFDEYTVAYRDRDLFYDRARDWTPERRADVPFGNVIVVAGRIVGAWKRSRRQASVTLEARWFTPPSAADHQRLAAAVERLGAFFGSPAEVSG